MEQLKTHPTIAACGLDCGLCPRYYTVGISRCPGCGGPDFSAKRPSCSFITCCVKRRGLEVCGQCPEFPCSKFKSEEEYRRRESSSYAPAGKMLSNLRLIQKNGIEGFLRQQRKRIGLLETMIRGYDDGRSRSFFCRAAALLGPEVVTSALGRTKEAMRSGRGRAGEAVDRTAFLRALLAEAARSAGIQLTGKK